MSLLIGISPDTVLGRIVSVRAETDKDILKNLMMSKEKSGMNGYRNILGQQYQKKMQRNHSEYGKDVYENGRVKCIELNAIYDGQTLCKADIFNG